MGLANAVCTEGELYTSGERGGRTGSSDVCEESDDEAVEEEEEEERRAAMEAGRGGIGVKPLPPQIEYTKRARKSTGKRGFIRVTPGDEMEEEDDADVEVAEEVDNVFAAMMLEMLAGTSPVSK